MEVYRQVWQDFSARNFADFKSIYTDKLLFIILLSFRDTNKKKSYFNFLGYY